MRCNFDNSNLVLKTKEEPNRAYRPTRLLASLPQKLYIIFTLRLNNYLL